MGGAPIGDRFEVEFCAMGVEVKGSQMFMFIRCLRVENAMQSPRPRNVGMSIIAIPKWSSQEQNDESLPIISTAAQGSFEALSART